MYRLLGCRGFCRALNVCFGLTVVSWRCPASGVPTLFVSVISKIKNPNFKKEFRLCVFLKIVLQFPQTKEANLGGESRKSLKSA